MNKFGMTFELGPKGNTITCQVFGSEYSTMELIVFNLTNRTISLRLNRVIDLVTQRDKSLPCQSEKQHFRLMH